MVSHRKSLERTARRNQLENFREIIFVTGRLKSDERSKKNEKLNKPTLIIDYLYFPFKLGFTPCKAEQPLRGMELQEKEAQKD